MIESWVQDQALILLAIGLAVVIIELCALLSTLLACTNQKSQRHKRKRAQNSTFTSTQTLSPFNESDHDYGKVILTPCKIPRRAQYFHDL
jgi:hypothetical protein